MNWTLEMIVLPTADTDRAKAFYTDIMGFAVDVDVSPPGVGRILQVTPPGSACSVTLMQRDPVVPVSGLHLVVPDLTTAREMLVARGAELGDIYHWVGGEQVAGADPQHRDFWSYLDLNDPDGNGWVLQEVPSRAAAG